MYSWTTSFYLSLVLEKIQLKTNTLSICENWYDLRITQEGQTVVFVLPVHSPLAVRLYSRDGWLRSSRLVVQQSCFPENNDYLLNKTSFTLAMIDLGMVWIIFECAAAGATVCSVCSAGSFSPMNGMNKDVYYWVLLLTRSLQAFLLVRAWPSSPPCDTMLLDMLFHTLLDIKNFNQNP